MIQVGEGLFQVPVAIPAPLRRVNCYLLTGDTGWTLVDTGFHTPRAERAWRAAFRKLGLVPERDLEKILVTHYHPDHFGCAGWLQEVAGGVPVFMLDRELPQVERYWQRGKETAPALGRFLRRHGVPRAVAERVVAQHRRHLDRVEPLPGITPLREGDVLAVGRRRLEVIWAPGHAQGLMVLWEPQEGLLLASDLVLERITPNVAVDPFAPADTLAAFFASLSRIRALPARLILPGHREPVQDLERRVDQIVRHHRERLQQVVEVVAGEGGATGWQVSLALFGEQADPLSTRLAVGEALAHLEHLVGRGELVRSEDGPGGAVLYRAA